VFFRVAGTKTEDTQLLRVNSGTAVTVYANGKMSGDSMVYTTAEHEIELGRLESVKVAPA
jgi:hypothetical protein